MANRRKILIEGAPGTGKTMTASIIASELQLPLYTVQMDKLVTKFMGETSVKLRQIFDSIENILGVYFFDEFDAIGADRGIDNEVGEMRRILNSFLQFLEQDNSDSIIIAATNNQRILDKALFRRFDDVLHYSMPSVDDVRKLFQIRFETFSPNFIPSNNLIEKAVSLSHAEISRVCDDAIKNSILDNTNQINEDILLRLLNERLAVYEKAVI
jgi:SpoVK/Ycf46/Vps4 family AAA+-type ATPase